MNSALCAANTSAAANIYTVGVSAQTYQIYVTPANSISSGNAAATPATSIAMPGVNIVSAVAVDSTGNIYASTATDIREYTANSTGAAPAARTIPFGNATSLSYSYGITVDSAGSIYASQPSTDSILVFSGSANGGVAPIRTISGALTGLVAPMQIALDGAGNLYVLNENSQTSILVFAPGANGNVAPIRSLSASLYSMAVDCAGDIYTTTDSGVNIYGPGASGPATPAQTVTDASLGYPDPSFNADLFAVDSAGNIYRGMDGVQYGGVYAGYTDLYQIAPPVKGTSTVLNKFVPPGWAPLTPITDYFVVH